jgi:hypothetical protein
VSLKFANCRSTMVLIILISPCLKAETTSTEAAFRQNHVPPRDI